MSHLGPRVSALLDGQLSAVEAERAWQHVQGCHLCRDHVEREGWVKTRLADWSLHREPGATAPAHLKAGLIGDRYLGGAQAPHREEARRPRRTVALVALGGGAAAGVAVMGVLALGTAPAGVPGIERRPPVLQPLTPSPAPARFPGGTPR